MVPVFSRIRRVARETADTFTLWLDPPAGASTFAFAPGQFNMLYAFGLGEVPISISGDPDKPEELVHTIRAVGPVTEAMARLKKGDQIGVRGPFGASWPVEAAKGKDVVIMAGGLGLAPLRPVIYHVLNHRSDYRRVSVLVGVRQPSDLLFQAELQGWRGHLDLDCLVTADHAGPDWYGPVGVVTGLLPNVRFDPSETIAMLCGPEIMMRFSARELEKLGMPAASIYLSMERNMKCAVGFCGHCQYGPTFVCKDGPVYRLDSIAWLLEKREI
jgi:NAD(P)H-flavin reductase